MRKRRLVPQDCGRNLGIIEGDGFSLRLAKMWGGELADLRGSLGDRSGAGDPDGREVR